MQSLPHFSEAGYSQDGGNVLPLAGTLTHQTRIRHTLPSPASVGKVSLMRESCDGKITNPSLWVLVETKTTSLIFRYKKRGHVYFNIPSSIILFKKISPCPRLRCRFCPVQNLHYTPKGSSHPQRPSTLAPLPNGDCSTVPGRSS